jgi:hypothetical protein
MRIGRAIVVPAILAFMAGSALVGSAIPAAAPIVSAHSATVTPGSDMYHHG